MKPFLIALLFVGTLLTGCKISPDAVTPATTTPTFLQTLPGTWTITSFTQGTEDKLKLLGTININFTSDYKAIATQGKEATAGS